MRYASTRTAFEAVQGGNCIMLQKEWPVLIVDDEPDVLAVTNLVLRDVHVDGVPLELHTAASKADAIREMTASPGPPTAPSFAVAFVDVVMETPSAGLEVCEFLRNDRKNRVTQLYIRTGQAGLAPERAVIDRYDINGYFTKIETSEDKLYSLVKAGVREYEFLNSSQILNQILSRAAGQPRSTIENVLSGYGAFLGRNQVSLGMLTNGEVLCAIGIAPDALRAQCERMERLDAATVSSEGDLAVYDDGAALFKSAQGDYLLFRNVSPPSPAMQLLQTNFLKVMSALAHADRGATVS
jgi:CheY-like chemotaxis protein